ncbi:MAG TPA: helix-turn-helix domain-containing protein [Solirubrobacteraceae bacterium]
MPLRATLPDLVEEVLDAVREGVPAYAIPLEGTFGRNVRIGVEGALGGFVELIESGPEAAVPGRDVYVGLGRGEVRAGRELDALLAAYRAGAQVAWRRFARAASDAGAPRETLIRLAEAVFAFIDELSAASAEGYAEASALVAGERQDRRRRLLDLLLADPPPPAAELEAAAQEAAWRLPKSVAVVVFEHDRPARLAARLPPEALVGERDVLPVAVVPDPDAPQRRRVLRTAFEGTRAALGPTVAPGDAARSAARAAAAIGLAGGEELVVAEERLLDLLLRADPALTRELVERRLEPLEGLPATTRARLTETLEAWLDHLGEARPTAEALHVHVQTVRYRLHQLRDLLGDALDDPAQRTELQLALRAERSGVAA